MGGRPRFLSICSLKLIKLILMFFFPFMPKLVNYIFLLGEVRRKTGRARGRDGAQGTFALVQESLLLGKSHLLSNGCVFFP